MRSVKALILAISVCLLMAGAAAAQAAKGPYKAIEIEGFTVRQGVEFTESDVKELTTATINNFRASKRFVSVSGPGESAIATDAGPTLKVSGEVTKYVKGSQAARYLIGLGAGKTKIMVDVKLTDSATGDVVFHQTVDGDVTWGLFGGDSDKAKGGVADELIREMKKRGLAGDKIRK